MRNQEYIIKRENVIRRKSTNHVKIEILPVQEIKKIGLLIKDDEIPLNLLVCSMVLPYQRRGGECYLVHKNKLPIFQLPTWYRDGPPFRDTHCDCCKKPIPLDRLGRDIMCSEKCWDDIKMPIPLKYFSPRGHARTFYDWCEEIISHAAPSFLWATWHSHNLIELVRVS